MSDADHWSVVLTGAVSVPFWRKHVLGSRAFHPNAASNVRHDSDEILLAGHTAEAIFAVDGAADCENASKHDPTREGVHMIVYMTKIDLLSGVTFRATRDPGTF